MRWSAIGSVLVLALAACAGRPGPPAREDAAPASAEVVAIDLRAELDDRRACGGCHAEITAEWSESQHRTAWSDPVFLAGYAVDRQPECRECHAPLHDGEGDPSASSIAAQTGVSCRSCHAREGAIAGPEGSRAHGGPVEPAWGRGAACDGCHEFSFPAGTAGRPAVFDPREPMQRTVSEWSQSRVAETCQDCHMPWRVDARGRRYRSHRMLGIDDPALMARAVRVKLRASSQRDEGVGVVTETLVEVEVHADAIGHAFPTGDMFRVAELRVWPAGEPERAQTLKMRREFDTVVRADAEGRLRAMGAEVADTRPRPGRPLRRRMRFEGRPPALEWSLVHLRMPREQAEEQGLPTSVVARPIVEGVVRLDESAR